MFISSILRLRLGEITITFVLSMLRTIRLCLHQSRRLFTLLCSLVFTIFSDLVDAVISKRRDSFKRRVKWQVVNIDKKENGAKH